ncbi:replication stress response regulator SDE2-like [Schistocerca gregaria]|uniref:replication stress response regulator SDE2-like n=1 Tax=Schistocerca gregaria TaxID=7010 RepID=UPI00211EEBCE|nr:replication stress response regulator SDE2-like [Schistocerca gregaria]XP_049849609.1 replication stress response regulator SDE2-like [Schistocerca gregaria]
MAQFIVVGLNKIWCIQSPSEDDELYSLDVSGWLLNKLSGLEGVPVHDIRLSSQLPTLGRSCSGNYRVSLLSRLRGGKGGYGTLLRGGGGTARRGPANTDFFRDLEGQRICDTAMIRQIQQTLEERWQSQSELSNNRSAREEQDKSEEELSKKQLLNAKKRARQEKLARLQKTAREELTQAAEKGLGNHLRLTKENVDVKMASIYGDVCSFESDEEISSGEEELSDDVTDSNAEQDSSLEKGDTSTDAAESVDAHQGSSAADKSRHGVKRSFLEVESGDGSCSLSSASSTIHEQQRKRVLVLDE